jgi:hypothetical protein
MECRQIGKDGGLHVTGMASVMQELPLPNIPWDWEVLCTSTALTGKGSNWGQGKIAQSVTKAQANRNGE